MQTYIVKNYRSKLLAREHRSTSIINVNTKCLHTHKCLQDRHNVFDK